MLAVRAEAIREASGPAVEFRFHGGGSAEGGESFAHLKFGKDYIHCGFCFL
jgi:hypothetical protein